MADFGDPSTPDAKDQYGFYVNKSYWNKWNSWDNQWGKYDDRRAGPAVPYTPFGIISSGQACQDVPSETLKHPACDEPRVATALDHQVGGDHYKHFKIQPVEFIHANGLSFVAGSAIKYLCRHREKGGRQDLEKAKHYIELMIQLEYPE